MINPNTDYNKDTLNEAINRTYIYTDIGLMFKEDENVIKGYERIWGEVDNYE